MNTQEFISNLFHELNIETVHLQKICKYTDFLIKANKKISLTSFNDQKSWLVSHIEDSLRAFKIIETLKINHLFDCGSGNGLPGLIFASLSPSTQVILCDIDQRKCEFLKAAAFKAGLKNTSVYPQSILTVLDQNLENVCYVYRGLGPERILESNFKQNLKARHFRFKSFEQKSLFTGSIQKKYALSDGSSRYIELK